MPPCCRDAACCEGRGDSVWRGYAARQYLGNHWREHGSPRISLRYAYPAGSLASLRRCNRFDCHFVTMAGFGTPVNARATPA